MSSNKNKKYWKNLADLNPLNNSALESLVLIILLELKFTRIFR